MGTRCCACSLTPILAVAGLLGLGAAGYRVTSGSCPLCHHENAAAAMLVSTTSNAGRPDASTGEKPASCAGMTETECNAKMSGCPAHGSCCDQKSAAEKVATAGK